MAIVANHRRCRDEHGARRHRSELADCGYRVSRHRIRRLMTQAQVEAVVPRRWEVITVSNPQFAVALNLLERRFAGAESNRVWVALSEKANRSERRARR